MPYLTLVLIVLVAAAIIASERLQARKRLPGYARPLPGPRGLPVIGNVHELPERNSWLKFHEWSKTYGPIYQVNLAGTNHVWITRDEVARDLLTKRSAIYSDRPYIPALEQDNRTSGQYLPLMSRNEKWARQRKFAKKIMDASESSSFYGYPELESVRLLFELLNEPGQYNVAMESFVARVTSRLAWGTPTPSDELKQRARELLIGVSPSGALGNKLPFLMSLPEKVVAARAWEARRSRTERKFFETVQEDVRRDMQSQANVDGRTSWTQMFLENKASMRFPSDTEGAFAVGMHGIAGALTIAAPMQSFCLAMCHYPQYQPVLHEEIDRVLGDRMPTFTDMPEMPVLRAFIRETLRWRPPVPTGIPHALVRDDLYNGYHIPAGSVIHPLEWSISRDPKVFLSPEEWNPMRWLEDTYPTYQEPLSTYPTITQYSQFGYGRRTCQGTAVTEADLFVGLGSVAWLFDMSAIKPEPESAIRTEAGGTLSGTVPHLEPAPPTRTSLQVTVDSDLSAEERAFFESNAEQIKRHSWRKSIGSFQPPSDIPTPPESCPSDDGEVDDVDSRNAGIFDARIPGEWPLEALEISPPASPITSDPKIGHADYPPADVAAQLVPDVKVDPAALDPTMDFSTLLIAKPMPFKFSLRVRNQRRAELVASKWVGLKIAGEFPDARVYWADGKSTAGDSLYGWGKVFS